MDGDGEVEFPFDLSEWTVVDEDVCEDNAGRSVIRNKTTGIDKKITSEALAKSKIISSTTHIMNQATSNNTGLATMNAAKATVSSSSGVAIKNVAKSTGSVILQSDPAKNVVKSNAPNSASVPAKNVVKSNTPSSTSNPAKNVVKSNTPSSTSDPAKNVVKPNTPSSTSDPAKNVVKANTPSSTSDPAKNVVKPNTPSSTSDLAKNVVKSNAPNNASNPPKVVVKPNTPSSTSGPPKNVVKSNTPSSTSDPAKNVTKSNTPSSTSDPAKNVTKSNTPSSTSDCAKNVVKSNTPSIASDPAKNLAKPTSGGINVAVKNIAKSVTPSKSTDSSNKLSNVNENKAVPTKNSTPNEYLSAGAIPAKTAASTSQTNRSGEAASISEISSLFNLSGNNSQIKTSTVAEKATPSKLSNRQTSQINSAGIVTTTPSNTLSKEAACRVISAPSSGSAKLEENKKFSTDVKPQPSSVTSSISACNSSKSVAGPVVTSTSKSNITTSSASTVAKPLSTVKNTGQLVMQTATSQETMKDKTNQVGSIAEIMESISNKTNANIYQCDMEDISDTELTETMDIAKCLVSKAEAVKVAGVKREALSDKEGPSVKKMRIDNSAASNVVGLPANLAVKQGPKQTQSNVNDPVNKGVKKGSFGAVKTVVMKGKSQPSATQTSTKPNTTPTANKTNVVENKSGTSTPSNMSVKRIIHRFHRMTQTVPKECSNKLLQCLIRIPSVDSPAKHKSNFAIQTVSMKTRDEVFYQKALPDTVRPEVFKVVSAFDLNHSGNRNILTGSFDYGISLGHVTAADMEKSLFRENLLTKSAHYSLYFDRQDFGVLDLLFAEEEQFLTVMTHIRKMKIGPRHLVVTYCKNMKETECAPGHQLSSVKATIIYNQNFASTSFLTHNKAPLWNKPKVEETMIIHNLPGGIPLDFLKLIIPDAITIALDDKKLKFTQEGSRARLGMNRKNGGDRFLKLFAQIYINNECVAISVAGSAISDVPELADILKEKEKRQKEKKLPVREMKAVPRDISEKAIATVKDDVDVIMHVETVANVDKILTGRISAWKGPSSVEKLKQTFAGKDQPKTITIQSTKNNSKELVLSDVSDFSDISDTSNIGEESSIKKKNLTKNSLPGTQKDPLPVTQKDPLPGTQKDPLPGTQSKPTTAVKKTPKPNDKKVMRPPPRRISKPLAVAGRNSQRKSTSGMSNERHGKEKPDRAKDEGHNRSPSKRSLDKSSPGNRDARQWKVENVGRGRFDSSKSLSGSDRKNDGYRKNITEDRGRDEQASFNERQHIERDEIKKGTREIIERFNNNLRKEETGRRELSSGRSDRERHRSEGRDDRRTQLNLEVDRRGNRIVSLWEKEEPERKVKDSYVQDRLTDKARHDKVIRNDIYNERDDKRGERLDRLVQKRLGSLERQERQSRDMRDANLLSSRSPNIRLIQRGRSTSPGRHRSGSRTSASFRRLSPAPTVGNQNRFARNRRSRSPLQRERGSGMSPIRMRDETRNVVEGVWLSQPPSDHNTFQQSERSRSQMKSASGLAHREDVRKTISRPINNRAALQADWKSSRVSQESEREQLDASNSRRLLEHFVERIIETSKASSASKASSVKRSPSQFVSGVKDSDIFFERMQEMYGSGVNFRDTGRGVGPSEASNTAAAVSTRTQGGSRAGGDIRVGSLSRPLPGMSVSPTCNRGPREPVNRFESRFNYEDTDAEDIEGFDAPTGSQSNMYCRESDVVPSQSGSGAYRESDEAYRESGEGYIESDEVYREPDGAYEESDEAYGESDGPYRESDGPYRESGGPYRDSDGPHRESGGPYRESGGPHRESSGSHRESIEPQREFGGPYRESSGPYREFGMMANQPSYHQNQNSSLPPPIPPPVAPPMFNPAPSSSQERLSQLEGLAKILAADIDHQQNEPPQNAAQDMWNGPPQAGFQMSGMPPPPPPPPPMPFSGPNSSHGQNMNFSGPPHPFRPPNIHPPHDMYSHPPPWSHGNYF